MKKLFILLFIIQLPVLLLAQQPFGKNATWVIEYDNEYGYSGFRKISYSHDTIINGEAWQKFSEAGVREIRTGPNPTDLLQWKYSGATFELLFLTRNDSVFTKDNNGVDEMLYDFNAQLGESWNFRQWDTSVSCPDTPKATVDLISTDIYNGVSISFMEISDVKDTVNGFYRCSSSWCLGGKKYYQLGGVAHVATGQYLPEVDYFRSLQNFCLYKTELQLPTYRLRCFQNDSLNIDLTNGNCEQWDFLKVEESVLNEAFKIFPNPNSSGELNIESLNEFDEIQITNLSGQMVQNLSIDSSLKSIIKIDLKGGLYFLQLKNKGKPQGIQKLIVQ